MNTEEKAKAYDEALERARKQRDDYQKEFNKITDKSSQLAEVLRAGICAIELAFPQLCESDNERIRKAIIGLIEELQRSEKNFGGVELTDMLAYLEKQEVNTEGDFGRGYDCGYQAGYSVAMHEMKPKVATATLDSEKQKEPHYTKRNALFDKCVENCDPDIMKKVSDEVDRLLQKEQKSNIVKKLREISTPADEDWFEIQKQWEKEDEQKPAESRKRNKPKESWLSKAKYEIEHADELLIQIQEELRESRELKKQEQKPLTTEETELNSIAFLEQMGYTCIPPGKEQKSTEWSEKDSIHLENAILSAEKEWGNESYTAIWLKSLPERFNLPPKEEWSEEDEDRIRQIERIAQQAGCTQKLQEEIHNWLKSLRPQYHGDVTMTEAYKMGLEAGEVSHWKPSEEQMEALKSAVKLYKDTHFEIHHEKIVSLYEQLKKLM